MTTTVSIKHDGPDHHDVMVTAIDPTTGDETGSKQRLANGETFTGVVYSNKGYIVKEVVKLVQ